MHVVLEVPQQSDLLLEVLWVVLKRVSGADLRLFLRPPSHVVKQIPLRCQHYLGGVVEVDPYRPVGQDVAHSVLARVVHPLHDPKLRHGRGHFGGAGARAADGGCELAAAAGVRARGRRSVAPRSFSEGVSAPGRRLQMHITKGTLGGGQCRRRAAPIRLLRLKLPAVVGCAGRRCQRGSGAQEVVAAAGRELLRSSQLLGVGWVGAVLHAGIPAGGWLGAAADQHWRRLRVKTAGRRAVFTA
mmetsp:Transcript_40163/g.125168  ORF Transcript_40163/g.125168 Transcript_40163/m.125168 type:complete len:243 (+) Transcript_40163:524-1252(+)